MFQWNFLSVMDHKFYNYYVVLFATLTIQTGEFKRMQVYAPYVPERCVIRPTFHRHSKIDNLNKTVY
jgi:hypothetical protein